MPVEFAVDSTGGSRFQQGGIKTFIQQFARYVPVSSSYISLREGGSMYLIQDDRLKRQITEYYEVEQVYMVQFYEIGFTHYSRWLDLAGPYLDYVLPAGAPTMYEAADHPRLATPWADFASDRALQTHIDIMGMLAGANAVRIEIALVKNRSLQAALRAALLSD